MNGRLIKPVATFLTLVGFAAVGMGGCESDGSEPYSRDRERTRIDDRPRGDYYEGDGGGRYRDQDVPKARASGIPESARLMEQGKGIVTFSPRRDGRVFVEDTHDLRLLLETQLFEGEVLTVDPAEDVIAIDGKPLPGPRRMRKLANDHRHRIYFYGERTQRPGGLRGDRDVRY